MGTTGNKGKSRRSHRKSREKQGRQATHFCTVCFGGFKGGQVIYYLREIVKSIRAERAAGTAGADRLRKLEEQMRGRVRAEMRRYFAKRRHRTIRMIIGILAVTLSLTGLLMFLVGVDRVTGTSIYPYLNGGDWIAYSHIRKGLSRDDVVVFERDGECVVKWIAGLPGDMVRMNASESRVVVSRTRIRESYVILVDMEQMETEDRLGASPTVTNGQYLVLGDNRGESIDSRDSDIGTVVEGEILGKVIRIGRVERQMMVWNRKDSGMEG